MAARNADHKFLFRRQEKRHYLVYDLRRDLGKQNPIDSPGLCIEGVEWSVPYRAWIRDATQVRFQRTANARKKAAELERRPDEGFVNKLGALGYTA